MKTVHCYIFICLSLFACTKDNDYINSIEQDLQSMNMPRPADSYNYPVYPGHPKWASFCTGEEMLKACQIPSWTARKMSTQALIQAIWEHPLLFEVFNRIQYQGDFERLFFQNNAYMELVNRKDAGVSLHKRMVLVNPLTRYHSQILELLCSQSVFLAKLNDNEKVKLVEIVLENDGIRQSTENFYNSHRYVSWLLISRIMLAANYAPFIEAVNSSDGLRFFLGISFPEGQYPSHEDIITYLTQPQDDFIEQIINLCKKYTNKF